VSPERPRGGQKLQLQTLLQKKKSSKKASKKGGSVPSDGDTPKNKNKGKNAKKDKKKEEIGSNDGTSKVEQDTSLDVSPQKNTSMSSYAAEDERYVTESADDEDQEVFMKRKLSNSKILEEKVFKYPKITEESGESSDDLQDPPKENLGKLGTGSGDGTGSDLDQNITVMAACNTGYMLMLHIFWYLEYLYITDNIYKQILVQIENTGTITGNCLKSIQNLHHYKYWFIVIVGSEINSW